MSKHPKGNLREHFEKLMKDKQQRLALPSPTKIPYCSLLVYGTLKEGHKNHYVLTRHGARKVGKGYTSSGNFTMYYLKGNTGYPIVLDGKEWPVARRGHVYGEVYRVPQIAMDELDTFEGGGYRRELIDTTFHFLGTDTTPDKNWYCAKAWMYIGRYDTWKWMDPNGAPAAPLAPYYHSSKEKLYYFNYAKFLETPPFEAFTDKEQGISK
jgi:gamma-glutamylcyclotransferase (GGCT)/AIG2-like uncharacterized protein YtfP